MHAMGSGSVDLAALPMLVLPVMAAGAALAREKRSARAATAGGGWLWVLGAAAVVAAVVHAIVAPEQFGESVLYGTFFLVTTVAGLGYAVAVLTTPTRPLLVTGLVANAGIVALWLFTRVVEVPVGPSAGEREAFGALDVVASGAELLCVVAAVSLLRAAASRQVSAQPAQC